MHYNYAYYWLKHTKGIMVRECASSYRRLSTFPREYIIVDSDKISCEILCHHGKINPVDKLDLHRCEIVKEGLYITDNERTIMDMIEFGSEGKLIEQSLETYYFEYSKDISELMDYAIERNLEGKLRAWLDIMEEDYNIVFKGVD